MRSEQEVDLALPAAPHAVPRARRALRDVEAFLPLDLVPDLRLLTSELVTNSVRHAQLDRDQLIRIKVRVSSNVVRVEVRDAGPGFKPDPTNPSIYQESGWGLYLVDQLASRWGIDRSPPPRVWFEIDRPPSDPS